MKYGKIDSYVVLSSIVRIEIRDDRLRLYTNGFGCSSSNRNAAFADYVSRILTSFGAQDYTVDFNYTTSEEWYDYIDLNKGVVDKFYAFWFDTTQKVKTSNESRYIEPNIEITDDDPEDDPDDDLDYDDVEGEDGVERSVKIDPNVVAAIKTSQRTIELLIRAAPTKKIKLWLESELESLNEDIDQLNKTGDFT